MSNKKLMISIVLAFMVIGTVFAVLGKFSILLWGILLLCPIMHLFGHNHSGNKHTDNIKHHH